MNVLDKRTTHPTPHKEIIPTPSLRPTQQGLRKETKEDNNDYDFLDDVSGDERRIDILAQRQKATQTREGYTEPSSGLREPNLVVGVSVLELAQPDADKDIIYDDTIAIADATTGRKVNYPEVGTTVVRTLRSRSLAEFRSVVVVMAREALAHYLWWNRSGATLAHH